MSSPQHLEVDAVKASLAIERNHGHGARLLQALAQWPCGDAARGKPAVDQPGNLAAGAGIDASRHPPSSAPHSNRIAPGTWLRRMDSLHRVDGSIGQRRKPIGGGAARAGRCEDSRARHAALR
jgi:hypothetical protein